MSARIVLLAILIAVAAERPCIEAQTMQPATGAAIGRIAWLAGNWIGTSGANTFEERWLPAAGDAMLAVSRTVRDNRMVGFEFLRIVERAGSLVYIAQPGGRPPTDFTATSVSADSVTFENPAHDFPKMIRYARHPDGTLEARVSGGAEPAETYVFKRMP